MKAQGHIKKFIYNTSVQCVNQRTFHLFLDGYKVKKTGKNLCKLHYKEEKCTRSYAESRKKDGQLSNPILDGGSV